MSCLSCVNELHEECLSLDFLGYFDDMTEQVSRVHFKCCCSSETRTVEVEHNKRGGPVKVDEDVTDPQSTGRKRAAVEYPIEEGATCEWSGLRYAGGGKYPIIGCIQRPASNRHHGPDKNTLNNTEGNVHRICTWCHNRWHTKNDPVYRELFGTSEWKAHDPETQATPTEQLGNEAYWQTTPTNRPDHSHP